MNPCDLDEAQGLTEEMVVAHLQKNGWALAESRDGRLVDVRWIHPDSKYEIMVGLRFVDENTTPKLDLNHVLEMLTPSDEPGEIQKLLREINPRMRKGLPSEVARKAIIHWMAMWRHDERILVGPWEDDSLLGPMLNAGNTIISGESLEQYSYWPCDKFGNKVPWPTNENGEML